MTTNCVMQFYNLQHTHLTHIFHLPPDMSADRSATIEYQDQDMALGMSSPRGGAAGRRRPPKFKSSPTASKVVLRSYFPETWLFELHLVGEEGSADRSDMLALSLWCFSMKHDLAWECMEFSSNNLVKSST